MYIIDYVPVFVKLLVTLFCLSDMYIMCVMFFQCFESGVGALQISIVIIIMMLFLPFFIYFYFLSLLLAIVLLLGAFVCFVVVCEALQTQMRQDAL